MFAKTLAFREAGRNSIYRFPPQDAERQNHAPLIARSAAGKETVGDTTTLEDLSVLAKLKEEEE